MRSRAIRALFWSILEQNWINKSNIVDQNVEGHAPVAPRLDPPVLSYGGEGGGVHHDM